MNKNISFQDAPWFYRKALLRLRYLLSTQFNRASCKVGGVSLGTDSVFLGRFLFIRHPGSKILIGNSFVSVGSKYDNPIGLNCPTLLRTYSENAIITIGTDVGISGAVISCTTRIDIGNNVLVGANSRIFDSDFHPIVSDNRRYDRSNVRSAPVVIGENCWLGAGSVILPGTTLGSNVIVAAGAIVKGDFSSNVIIGGVPAKQIRSL